MLRTEENTTGDMWESRHDSQARGFTLIEVMLSMIILTVGVMAVVGAFRWANQGLRHGELGMRALAMAESRIEAKRAAPWNALLTDDLDRDGLVETSLRDDGMGNDEHAGDGVYTTSVEQDGVHVVWTVEPDRPGPLIDVGSVVIRSQAAFSFQSGPRRTIELRTLRANPNYIGRRED